MTTLAEQYVLVLYYCLHRYHEDWHSLWWWCMYGISAHQLFYLERTRATWPSSISPYDYLIMELLGTSAYIWLLPQVSWRPPGSPTWGRSASHTWGRACAPWPPWASPWVTWSCIYWALCCRGGPSQHAAVSCPSSLSSLWPG